MRLLLAAVVLTGCAAPGDLAFIPEMVDFGPALPGVERTQAVELINRSSATVVLTEVRASHPSFSLSFPPGLTFSPGELRGLEVRYTPQEGVTAREEGTLEVLTNSPGVSATLTVAGVPTTPDCALPQAVDFGAVARGDTAALELSLLNATSHEGTVFVGAVESATAGIFAATPGSFPVPPGEEHKVGLSFSPTEAGEYTATLRVSRHQLCPEGQVLLRGAGTSAVLAWTPAVLDFGAVGLGQTGRLTVTFTNQRFRPVQLSGVAVHEASIPNVFSAVTRALTVPAAQRNEEGNLVPGSASLEIVFSPAVLGPRTGQLTAVTDLAAQPGVSVILRGSGAP